MFEELFHLLSQLRLGAAARPLCDLVSDLTGESMSLPQLRQEIRNVLKLHGGGNCADAVIAAMVELGFAGLRDERAEENEGAGAAVRARGASAIGDSELLASTGNVIVAEPRVLPGLHETARGWLDIDGGIYFDVRQHAAGTGSER